MASSGLDVDGGKVCRSSSRFCLGVEHGDYNGTELLGVGTDRFIWNAYKPNNLGEVRLFSANFSDDGVVSFKLGDVPAPLSVKDSWARFPYGVDYVLGKAGLDCSVGFDCIIYGNIPGGGMSRSASLTLNLIHTFLDVNDLTVENELDVVDLAVAVENEYIGSPCGALDQIMIQFAKAKMATHYNPSSRTINYIPLGEGHIDFRIMIMDTGTVRPGLEKSTYKVRRTECDDFTALLIKDGYPITCLADVRDNEMFHKIIASYRASHSNLCDRFDYIFHAQQRFYKMLEAWQAGDVETVGENFRKDGIGLRDDYKISGGELEAMCDIVRGVDGALGERMLGGGDVGAAGALVRTEAVATITKAIDNLYPKNHQDYADKYAIHTCKIVDGICVLEDLL
jgi:galactokinase